MAAQRIRRCKGERVADVKQHAIGAGWFPGGRTAWGLRLRDATAPERAEGAPKSVLEPQGRGRGLRLRRGAW